MLPRLDFHSSLRDAVLDGRKTATTRLVGELDSNTDADGLRPGMRAAATCQGETFAELTILVLNRFHMMPSTINSRGPRTVPTPWNSNHY